MLAFVSIPNETLRATSDSRDPYDLIASLGDWCAPAANIRRRFGVTQAMPFDWWVSPYNGTIKLLEERFANLLRPQNLQVVAQGGRERSSVLCKYYGILHHHDFARDEHEFIMEDIHDQLPLVVEKFRSLTERFLTAFQGKRALFIRNSLNGELWDSDKSEPYPAFGLQMERAERLHRCLRDLLSTRVLDIIILSDVERGKMLNLEGGSVVFEQLGERIGDNFFWDQNYDMLFDRLCIRMAE